MADMALFPKLFGDIDLAILPVGSHYTMCAKKASFAAAELLKTKKVIGCHFDTFPPIAINHDEALKIFKEKEVELVLPQLGEIFEIKA
jgi:L-ascorbate metabolism protein UlaG (beta-lactamase superfamily)